jgi:hypothetical protein
MTPFVWSVMGEDAAQPLPEILLRKEAERITGGDFWWGLGTPLGDRVASAAATNGGVLPALFSALGARKHAQSSNQVVRIWNGWCSIRNGQSGTTPNMSWLQAVDLTCHTMPLCVAATPR